MSGGIAVAVVLALVSSAWLVAITIRVARALGVGIDSGQGVQKAHYHWVPRLGGIPIFCSIFVSMLALAWATDQHVKETAFLIVCLLPAFGIGLVEDFTGRAGVLVRLVFTMIAAALGWWLLDAKLTFLDLDWLDPWLAPAGLFAFCFTLVAASGISHAINIIDGCNGLSGFIAMVALACIGVVAWQVGDTFVATTALIGVAALFGFFIWNFPMGRIFMGDAGAYLVGFLIAVLSIRLTRHNPEVSPWFPMLLMIYPVWETVYSMFRRAVFRRSSIGKADKLHLHQLIYYRLVRWFQHSGEHAHQAARSSVASAYLWVLSLMCALPALIFWDNTPALKALCVLFIGTYLLLHGALVSFRAPRVLIVSRSRRLRQPLPELLESGPDGADLGLPVASSKPNS